MPKDSFVNYLKNLLNTDVEIEKENILENIVQENNNSDLEDRIKNGEIISSINSIHSNKSPGHDGIYIEMFTNIQNEILPYSNRLFNEIFDKGDLPSEWW